MKRLLQVNILAPLIFMLILVPLLGLAARPHAASQELANAARAQDAGALLDSARHLALAAQDLPGRVDLFEQAGDLATSAGDPQAAIGYYSQAGDHWPDLRGLSFSAGRAVVNGLSLQGAIKLGEAYQQIGNLPAAIEVWQEAANSFGSPPELEQRLYQAERDRGNYQAAIPHLQSLVVRAPGDARLRYQLGLVMATQEPEAALAFLLEAALMDPSLAANVETLKRNIVSARMGSDHAYSLLSAGRALATLGEWELAGEAFRQATLAQPNYAEAWAYLGEARQHTILKAYSGAAQGDSLAALQKAIDLDPKSLAANTFMALYWNRQGKFAKAQQALETAILLDPVNPSLFVELGNTLSIAGDLQGAQAAFKRAVDLAPRDPSFLRMMATFSLRYDYRMQEIALPAARRAVALDANDPNNLDLMGQVLIKMQDLLNAQRFLDRAIQADPNFASAHLHLGSIYMVSGNHDAARRELDLARSLAPGSLVAQQAEHLLQNGLP